MNDKLKKLHDYLKSNGFYSEANDIVSISNDSSLTRGASCDKIISEGSDYWMVDCGTTEDGAYSYILWAGPNESDGPRRFSGSTWVASEGASGRKRIAWGVLEKRRRDLEADHLGAIRRERNRPPGPEAPITNEDIESPYDGSHYGGGIGTAPGHFRITNPEGAAKVDRMLESQIEPVVHSEEVSTPDAEQDFSWVGRLVASFGDYSSKVRDPEKGEERYIDIDGRGLGAKVIEMSPRSRWPERQESIKILVSKDSDGSDEEDGEDRFNVSTIPNISGKDRFFGMETEKTLSEIVELVDERKPEKIDPTDKDSEHYDAVLVRKLRMERFKEFLANLANKDRGNRYV